MPMSVFMSIDSTSPASGPADAGLSGTAAAAATAGQQARQAIRDSTAIQGDAMTGRTIQSATGVDAALAKQALGQDSAA